MKKQNKQQQHKKGTGEKKERDLRKTISQLKAQLRQERKMRTLAEEEILRLKDIVQDVDALETARRIARGRRKKLTECDDCGMLGVTEQVIDLGARVMVKTECQYCDAFNSKIEEK